jgi:hypothetical protein
MLFKTTPFWPFFLMNNAWNDIVLNKAHSFI